MTETLVEVVRIELIGVSRGNVGGRRHLPELENRGHGCAEKTRSSLPHLGHPTQLCKPARFLSYACPGAHASCSLVGHTVKCLAVPGCVREETAGRHGAYGRRASESCRSCRQAEWGDVQESGGVRDRNLGELVSRLAPVRLLV